MLLLGAFHSTVCICVRHCWDAGCFPFYCVRACVLVYVCVPWRYAQWVGLQGDLGRLHGERQADPVNVQGVHLVLEVHGQLVTGLLQNASTGSQETVRTVTVNI